MARFIVFEREIPEVEVGAPVVGVVVGGGDVYEVLKIGEDRVTMSPVRVASDKLQEILARQGVKKVHNIRPRISEKGERK